MTLALVLAEAAAQAAPVKGVAAVANNFQIALLAFKSGGWIVALIGAAAMVGRLLVDEAADAGVDTMFDYIEVDEGRPARKAAL